MSEFKSTSLRHVYPARMEALAPSPEDAAFIDAVYSLCEANYEAGGDVVVETMTPADVLKEFAARDLDDVRAFCGLHVERALDARWGEDADPELVRADRFDAGWTGLPAE